MRIVITTLVGDLGTLEISCSKKFSGPVYSKGIEVIPERFSNLLAEDCTEMAGTKVEFLSNTVHMQV